MRHVSSAHLSGFPFTLEHEGDDISTSPFGGAMGLLLAKEKWERAFLASLLLHKRCQLAIMGP